MHFPTFTSASSNHVLNEGKGLFKKSYFRVPSEVYQHTISATLILYKQKNDYYHCQQAESLSSKVGIKEREFNEHYMNDA